MGSLLKKVIEKLSEIPPDELDESCAGLLKELEAEGRREKRFAEMADELAAAVAEIDAKAALLILKITAPPSAA